MRYWQWCVAATLAGLVVWADPPSPTFTHVFPLAPEEGVFAYARISPAGDILAYASQMPIKGQPQSVTQTVRLVDLTTQKVLFSEPGIDAYWSNDGQRIIFLSKVGPVPQVALRHNDTGLVLHDIAPADLGDYFSWAVRGGEDLILTIRSNYYHLRDDHAVLPSSTVPTCDGIGVGDRPLISRDGKRITTFVRGNVVVRDLTDCGGILDTGLQGAKADFSWDGRYIAFHVPKKNLGGYEIAIVDTQKKTVRTVSLPGSTLFPSWTRDGRLCFRYDADDYRGFMMADHVLDAPERPLPESGSRLTSNLAWGDLFPETPKPVEHLALVLVWSSWSAHSPFALDELQRAQAIFRRIGIDVSVRAALELSSQRADVDRLLSQGGITIPEITLAPNRLRLTEAMNQIPTALLFRDGVLVDRRLGAQSADELLRWVK